MNDEEKTTREYLKEIASALKGERDEPPRKIKKGFWMPMKARVGRRAARKGKITVMKIMENRNVEFEKQNIDEQTIMVDGIPRVVTSDDTLIYRGKPIVVIPSWSVKPFSPTENYSETVKQQHTSQGYKLLMNKIKKEQIENKKKIPVVTIFIVIVVIIALGYFASKGGLF